MKNGVSASCLVLPYGRQATSATILEHLIAHVPAVSASAWRRRIDAGEVYRDGGAMVTVDGPFEPGLRVWYYRELEGVDDQLWGEAPVILFQDHSLVALDKPHGLPITPKGRYVQHSALVWLKRQLQIETLVPMHRLDLETAGVVLFSVQAAQRHAYQNLWATRQVHKRYLAWVSAHETSEFPTTLHHRLEEPKGEGFMQMQVHAGEPNAHLALRVVRREPNRVLLALHPSTGRKHQLRAQLSAAGWPILGDRIYPKLLPQGDPKTLSDPATALQLLASSLEFVDPITGQARIFHSRRQLLGEPTL